MITCMNKKSELQTDGRTDDSETGIPWQSGSSWQAVNQSILYLAKRYEKEMAEVTAIAEAITDRLSALSPFMDKLCAATCPECEFPCCTIATLWFDFRDLLLLHFSGQKIPSAQILRISGKPCTCLGHKGCSLPRIARPWICTWYICPPQTAIIRSRDRQLISFFDSEFREIKQMRKMLEDTFLKITT